VFLPWHQRPGFTSIQNYRQNYSFVHYNCYVFYSRQHSVLNKYCKILYSLLTEKYANV
jgi:hypothetical protein